MASSGLQNRIALLTEFAATTRDERDKTVQQKRYQKSFNEINKLLDLAIANAAKKPLEGILISRHCTQFVMKAIPSPDQDPGRAHSLSQCNNLRYNLALVMKPSEYIAAMKEEFGPDLDIRNYAQNDSFNTIIRSQRQQLLMEGKGYNTQDEKNFCRKRRDLLAAVEKSYNQLRSHALGIPVPEKQKGRSR